MNAGGSRLWKVKGVRGGRFPYPNQRFSFWSTNEIRSQFGDLFTSFRGHRNILAGRLPTWSFLTEQMFYNRNPKSMRTVPWFCPATRGSVRRAEFAVTRWICGEAGIQGLDLEPGLGFGFHSMYTLPCTHSRSTAPAAFMLIWTREGRGVLLTQISLKLHGAKLPHGKIVES